MAGCDGHDGDVHTRLLCNVCACLLCALRIGIRIALFKPQQKEEYGRGPQKGRAQHMPLGASHTSLASYLGVNRNERHRRRYERLVLPAVTVACDERSTSARGNEHAISIENAHAHTTLAAGHSAENPHVHPHTHTPQTFLIMHTFMAAPTQFLDKVSCSTRGPGCRRQHRPRQVHDSSRCCDLAARLMLLLLGS